MMTVPSESVAYIVIYALHLRDNFSCLKIWEKQAWARKKWKTRNPRKINVLKKKNVLKSITIDTRVFFREERERERGREGKKHERKVVSL